MNETNFNALIAMLARGDGEGAQAYLMHFPRKDRERPVVREGLAARVHPAALNVLMDLHPWLLESAADETPGRIRAALREAGTAGLKRAELRDKVSGVSTDELRHALDAMVEAREVVIERKHGTGRPADVFRLPEFAHGVIPANWRTDPFAGPLYGTQ